jgi:hypothetical protein
MFRVGLPLLDQTSMIMASNGFNPMQVQSMHSFPNSMITTSVPTMPPPTLGGNYLSQTVHLYQHDFTNGPYVINKPGTYILMEDIVFDPFPNAFGDVFTHLAQFPSFNHEYVLGFFAAIIVYGENIVLDLNKHKIRQSLLHNFQQRFFALIELANRPFLPGQGPANFGSPIVGCKNVTIKNGVLGLSSHHGIHGNNATNVIIQDLTIYDYEVAGITLNGCQNIRIERVDVRQNYKNILVNGLYSNAIFTIKKLISIQNGETDSINLPHVGPTIGTTALSQFWSLDAILDRLRKSVVDLYDDFVNKRVLGATNPDSLMYVNEAPYVTDGNCYGITINTVGLLVNEYKHTFVPGTRTVNLTDVSIHDLDCKPVEYRVICDVGYDVIRALPDIQTHASVNKGPFGDIIDFFRCVDETQRFTHHNNALILAQVLTGTVSETMKDWVRDGTPDFEYRIKSRGDISVLTNLDIMAHVMKGTMGLFLSSVENVQINNLRVANIRNRANKGFDEYVTDSNITHHGARTSGILIASSRNMSFVNTTIDNIVSDNGEAYGYYLHGDCTTFAHRDDHIGSLRISNDYQSGTSVTPCIVQSIGSQK